jgi:hypothetical protein
MSRNEDQRDEAAEMPEEERPHEAERTRQKQRE